MSHSIGESFSENVSNSQSQSTGFSQNSSVSNGMSAGFNTGNSNNQGVSELEIMVGMQVRLVSGLMVVKVHQKAVA